MLIGALGTVALATACVGANDGRCGRGEVEVCITSASCLCGAPCAGSSECAAGDVCLPDYRDSDRAACFDPVTAADPPLCSHTCEYAGDGECDDGGSGSLYSLCDYGTDCEDCGARTGGTDPPPTTSCPGGCASGEVCVSGYGCTPTCSASSECSTGCCASAGGGAYSVCAPSTYCGTTDPPPTGCTDLSGCIEVVSAVRGGECGDPDSLRVVARNTCSQTIMIQTCLERTNGTWDCGLDSSVSPGGENGYWTCSSTGRYVLTGHHPDDFGRGCVNPPS